MGILDIFRAKQPVASNVKKVQASHIEGLPNLQTIDFNYSKIDFTDSWVKYSNFTDVVHQIDMRYNKMAPFGCSSVKTIVQFLAAWALKDITVIGETKEHDEFYEMLKKQFNMDKFISELATISELQGHAIVEIRTKNVNGELTFKPVIIPYKLYKYQLLFDSDLTYMGYQYQLEGVTKKVDNKKSQFFSVYGFDSDYLTTNYPIPSVGYVIENCDAVDKALENIRHTNKYFAKKTPVINTQDDQTADKILNQIEARDWKITSFLVATGIDVKQIGADNEGVKVLIEEILTNQQMISGTVGIPIDKLGHPEKFSSQSVRLENSESINVQASPKRVIYKSGLEEFFGKCITIYNETMGKTLSPTGLEVFINESAISLQERKATMLNDAFDRGVIDQTYYLENHPIISDDANDILKRMEKEKLERQESINTRVDNALNGIDDENTNPM
jgi:hypothetical protein